MQETETGTTLRRDERFGAAGTQWADASKCLQMDDSTGTGPRPACVLITDGESRPALAATRSLSRAGYCVEVLTHTRTSRAGSSRHASAVHLVPNAADDPVAWAWHVETLLDRAPNQLLLPITEVALGSLFSTSLDQRPDTLTPNPSAYHEITNKAALMERAASLGIDIPKSLLVDDPKSMDRLPEGFSYPVVLKPKVSRWLESGHWRHGDVRVAHNEEQLLQHLTNLGMTNGFLMQEFVPGHGESICLLTKGGIRRASFSHRRLRERPPGGGVSVLSESRKPDPELLAASEKLLASVSWDGIAMVEFRRDPNGRAALMEVNPRFWGSLQLAVDANVDFPRLAVSLFSGETFPEPIIQEGKRLRWLLGDFDHLWMVLLRPDSRSKIRFGRIRALGGFLRSFFDGSKLEVCRLRDIRPMWADIVSWFG